MLEDVRFAIRSFARSPRFTIPALLALALGIGSTSAIFSVVQGVILKPLPYRDPDRIVVVWENNVRRNNPRNVIGAANFLEWRARTRSLDHLAMVGQSRQSVMLGGQPEEITGVFATSELFPALGVAPMLGRGYNADEDLEGQDLVIVLGYEYWRTRLNGRAGVLGTKMMLNSRPRTILGVMPPGFTVIGQPVDYLIPYGFNIEAMRTARGRGSSHAIARLRDGVSFEQAESDMKNIAAQLEKEVPQRNANWSITLVPVHEQMVDQIRPALLVLSAAVAFVLLIACVNVANLLLARSTVRERELGIRSALGARRARLVRQMLTESLLLACAGGAAGLALAVVLHRGLIALAANRIAVPRLEQVALDAPVLAFALVVSIVSGLVFGIIPALIASTGISDALKEGGRHGGGRRSRRVLGALVVAEVAISLVLLTGAGLLVRSFMRLQEINPGFRTESVLTARLSLPGARYSDDRVSSGFFTDVVDRVSGLPGVRAAAGVSFLPMAGLGIGTTFYVDGQPEPPPGQSPAADVRPVTPGFFRAIGIPHLAGRDFAAADRDDTPRVAIISESLARRHLSGENPLGKRLNVFIGPPGGKPWEIVGIVGDIHMTSLEGDVRPAVYVPHTQLTIGLMTLVVRTDVDPMSLVSGVAGTVHAIDPELPLADMQTLDDVVDATLARPRAVAVLLTAFAVMALVLAGVGVYGVMAYSVAQRTQEIGVRMALGATPESVFRMVLTQALQLVAIGVGAGLIAAGGLTRLLATLLYETEPLDPITFATTALLLVCVATIASYIPARRGTRVAPVEALRAE